MPVRTPIALVLTSVLLLALVACASKTALDRYPWCFTGRLFPDHDPASTVAWARPYALKATVSLMSSGRTTAYGSGRRKINARWLTSESWFSPDGARGRSHAATALFRVPG